MKLKNGWYEFETNIHFSEDVDIDYDKVLMAILNTVYDETGVEMYLEGSSLTSIEKRQRG